MARFSDRHFWHQGYDKAGSTVLLTKTGRRRRSTRGYTIRPSCKAGSAAAGASTAPPTRRSDRILGNVPLPVPINSIDRWRPINRIAKMLLRGAVHLNAGDMHCFYRDLFPSPDAAAQAIHRWNGRVALIAEVKRLARQLPAPWVEVTWQPNGQGHRTRTSYVASANLAAVHAEALREFPAGLAAWTATPSPRRLPCG